MFVGLVLIVINKSINIVIMSNICYGGNLIYSHGKIKEELKNDKLRNVYSEKIIDKILKGNIYNYVSYYKYYKLEIINNYLCSYYKHLELSSSIVKGIYVFKSLYLIDDLIGLILEKLKNIKVKIYNI